MNVPLDETPLCDIYDPGVGLCQMPASHYVLPKNYDSGTYCCQEHMDEHLNAWMRTGRVIQHVEYIDGRATIVRNDPR